MGQGVNPKGFRAPTLQSIGPYTLSSWPWAMGRGGWYRVESVVNSRVKSGDSEPQTLSPELTRSAGPGGWAGEGSWVGPAPGIQ